MGAETCHGFALNPKCNAPSATCIVEKTIADASKSLNYYYFKTILNSVEVPEQPGNILEFKVSSEPFTSAPV